MPHSSYWICKPDPSLLVLSVIQPELFQLGSTANLRFTSYLYTAGGRWGGAAKDRMLGAVLFLVADFLQAVPIENLTPSRLYTSSIETACFAL